MPLILPTASDAVAETRRIADSMVDDFRKFKDPHDPSPEAATEKFVLTSVAIFYYERATTKKFDHTIGVALYDSEEAMAYMDYPEAILQRLKNSFFGSQGTEVWRRSHNEWAFSWSDEKDDD
jgi:hypothetical protein